MEAQVQVFEIKDSTIIGLEIDLRLFLDGGQVQPRSLSLN
jgi:hypothetical protein